jgi:DNA-binding transcriptional ArsR family regulator
MLDEGTPRRSRDLEQRRERARSHPLRVKILALHQQDLDRSLAALDLMPTLAATRAPGEGDLSLSTVAYHVRVLQEAELILA